MDDHDDFSDEHADDGGDDALPDAFRHLLGGDLPDGVQEMLSQLGGAGGPDLQGLLQGFLGSAPTGPVNWELARRLAFQQAAEDDRGPTSDERAQVEQAFEIAEHWLDETSLPAAATAGRLHVARRTQWVDAALTSMRPLVEPVVAASTRAMTSLMSEELGRGDAVPPELAPLLGMFDVEQFLRPMAATMAGVQVGQILGTLSCQLLGQYDLGLPTAPRATAFQLPVNVAAVFDGYDLDPTEVAVVLALHESAHRRLFHAVPWLEAHLHGLVAQFANGTEVDPDQLRRLAEDAMANLQSEPEDVEQAMAALQDFRLDPTPAQERVLQRIQGIVTLVQGWATHEVARVAAARLPGHDRVVEVLRRRRAVHGAGDEQLARLLGLDLTPKDPELGERFVAAVADAAGPDALRTALAHPENLPDVEELADPSRWAARIDGGDDGDGAVPDDLSTLFALDAEDAPVEATWEERVEDQDDGDGPA